MSHWVKHWKGEKEMRTAGEYVAQNPKLFEKINVKVLRAFYVDRQLQEIGTVVSLERHLAQSLQAVGKAEIINAEGGS